MKTLERLERSLAKASEESCCAKMTSISGAAVKREIGIVGRIRDLAIDRCEECLACNYERRVYCVTDD